MAARRHEENRSEFRLDLSQVEGFEGRKEELKTSLEREYSELSITPRAFQGREYVGVNTEELESIIQTSRTNFETIKATLDGILSISSVDIDSVVNELIQTGLITEGKGKQTKGKAKKAKKMKDTEQMESKLTSLVQEVIGVAEAELDKLEAGINKFESSIAVSSIITVDHYENTQGIRVAKYGMSLTSDLVSDIEEFNSDVAARITEIAASSIGSAPTSKSKKSKGIEDTNNFIHLVELCLMKKALSEVFEGNPVLVETFARDFEGRIVVEDKQDGDVMTQIPEVHTVLLYKMPGAGNNQVLIIDPRAIA